jgi:RNA polymerase-binding transcription factor DksA
MKNSDLVNSTDNIDNTLKETVSLEFDRVPSAKIAESQGDIADRAQEQIDRDINEKIIQIRRNLIKQMIQEVD